jgi:hypothetical protein
MVWVAEWQRREEVKSVKKVLTIQMKASSTDWGQAWQWLAL